MGKGNKKQICVITGGTGGIGYYLSEGFYQQGYKVIALDKEQHQKMSDEIDFIKVDLKEEQQICMAFDKIKETYGAVHILINNGAISKFSKSVSEISVKEFDEVLAVNLRGSFICCQQFILANKAENFGRIINIASTRWNQNEANWEAYGASKAGLVSLTNTLAVSLANTPITVNAISPGWIQVSDYETLTDEEHKQHPSGRVGKAKDVLNACLFFADVENDFLNAVNLVVDGGMTKKMIYYTDENDWDME